MPPLQLLALFLSFWRFATTAVVCYKLVITMFLPAFITSSSQTWSDLASYSFVLKVGKLVSLSVDSLQFVHLFGGKEWYFFFLFDRLKKLHPTYMSSVAYPFGSLWYALFVIR